LFVLDLFVHGEMFMSKFRILIVFALFATLSAFGQSPSSAGSATSSDSTSTQKHKQMRGDRAEQRLKRLSKKLNLTDEQKEKARPIVQDEEKQIADLDNDSAMTPQQKHKKTREIRMASRTQLDSILTPEQKEKLPARRAGAGGGHHHQRPTSVPPSSDQSPQQ
jgi:Spy/CpxP family protein refolding chaperone